MTGLTVYITCDGAAKAIAFYTQAFSGTERYRIPMDDGRIGHAEMEIGGSTLMISDEAPQYGAIAPTTLNGSTCALVFDCEDPDAVYAGAVALGARADRPVTDAPFGRSGWLVDPFGHRWNIQRSNPDFDAASMGASQG